MVQTQRSDTKRIWIRRAAYLALTIAAFVGLPLLLYVIAYMTGVIQFRYMYGPFVWFNDLSAPAFLIAFFAILVMIGVIIYFILKMFGTSEGGW